MEIKFDHLSSMLQERLIKGGSKTAFTIIGERDEAQSITYEQLNNQVMKVAANLQHELGSEKIVLLLFPTGLEFIISFLACLVSNVVAVPLPLPRNSRDRLNLERLYGAVMATGATTALMRSDDFKLLDNIEIALNTLDLKDLANASASDFNQPSIASDDIAYLQFTSGSSGKPRGVMLAHQEVLKNLATIKRAFSHDEFTVTLSWLPLYHDMGLVGHVLQPIFEGGSSVLMPPSKFLRDPLSWLRAIEKYRVNTSGGPSFGYELCVSKFRDGLNLDLSSWRNAYVGSDHIPSNVLDDFSTCFSSSGFRDESWLPCYGLAEVTLFVAGSNARHELSIDKGALAKGYAEVSKLGNNDKRLFGYQINADDFDVQIVNVQTKEVCESNKIGEIWLKGASIGSGYYGNKEASDAVFDQKIKGDNPDHYMRTGDLGFVMDDKVFLTGRCKDLIIVRGVNHYPQDIEKTVLMADPGPTHQLVACFAVNINGYDELVVLRESRHRKSTSTEVKKRIEAITSQISDAHVIGIHKVILVKPGAIIRTSSGKVSRSQCKQFFLENKFENELDESLQSVDSAINNNEQHVAVIGMGCRFPGSVNSLEEFWTLLSEGRDAISEVPESRWNVDSYYSPQLALPGKMNTRWGGFIDDVDQFDPQFFSISPHEATEMDPQQRILLETAWRSFEHAGITREQLKGSKTGVFVGISNGDYLRLKFRSNPEFDHFNAYSGLGNAFSIAANRISYAFDLQGPSIAVDTACSSSLTAIHMAARSILEGECDMAIAGGINLMLAPDATILLSQFGMMADDGRCKTFDESANGYVRSEGCGLVVLRRADLAKIEKDPILAWILGSAQGQDGRSNGMTSPNPEAQKRLLLKALNKAQIDPAEVTYVEAHGTGTKIGDPVEMLQLKSVYGQPSSNLCHVGSVKANIGHLEAAAGVAGLIKLILAMQHKQIPEQVHLKKLNSEIDLAETRFQIPTKLMNWNEQKNGRLAAISSFGFGGALVHMVLKQADVEPEMPTRSNSSNHNQLLTISADSPLALEQVKAKWQQLLSEKRFNSLRQLCQSAATRRSHFRYRSMAVASAQSGLRQALENTESQDSATGLLSGSPIEAVYLFSGQSGHYAGMGKHLYSDYKEFRDAFDTCAKAFEKEEEILLTELVFSDPEEPKANGLTTLDEFAQPALFAVEYAMSQLWISWGITPQVLLGHSLGEITAACVAGCMDVEDAMKLVMERGRLMTSAPGHGGMLSVFSTQEYLLELTDFTTLDLSIAAINGPELTVVSGPMLSLQVLVNILERNDIKSRFLDVVHAFHSQMMDPLLDEFESIAEKIKFQSPKIALVSSLTGKPMIAAPDASYWRRHLRDCVQFKSALDYTLNSGSSKLFVEIGPSKTLTSLVRHNQPILDAVYCLSLDEEQAGNSTILNSLGQLYLAGANLDWSHIYDNPVSIPGTLPEHPFHQQRYWFDEVPKLDGVDHSHDKETHEASIFDMTWQSRPVLNAATSTSKADGWIIVGDGQGFDRVLERKLREESQSVFLLRPTDKKSKRAELLSFMRRRGRHDIAISRECDSEEYARALNRIINKLSRYNVTRWRVVYLGAMDCTSASETSTTSIERDHASVGVAGLLSLVKGMKKVALSTSLWVVTRNAFAVECSDENVKDLDLNVVQSPVLGLMKTVYLEHPELRGGLVDLDSESHSDNQLELLLTQMKTGIDEAQVAFRNSQRYVQVLDKVELKNTDVYSANSEGAYLITGGLGGLGLACAEWLVQKSAKHIYLLGRNTPPETESIVEGEPPSKWSKTNSSIHNLRNAGVKVTPIGCDIRDHELVESILKNIRSKRPLAGIIHAAGVNWVAKTVEVDNEAFLDAMAIKASAAWNLHELTLNDDLDLFVLFSSVSALWGSVGLSHYTASNYFLDSLAQLRNKQDKPAVCVDWGPWSDVGMSAKQEEVELLSMLGLNMISPQTALELMEKLIVENKPQAVIADFNWNRFQSFANFSLSPSMFENISRLDTVSPSSLISDGLKSISSLPAAEARTELLKVIQGHLNSVLHNSNDTRFDEDTRFNFMGMDSLTAMTFCARLETQLGLDISAMAVYNYPTSGKFADYLYSLAIERSPESSDSLSVVEEGRFFNISKANSSAFKLFCFPYAGGGPSIFSDWTDMMNHDVDIIPLELPGRENRISEPAMTDMPDIVKAIVEELIPFTDQPYGFFGHSLGGVLCFEVARELQSRGLPLPQPIVISGSVPSQYREQKERLHELPNQELIVQLSERFGIVPLDGWTEDLQKALIPTLKADMKLSESAEITEQNPLQCLVHLFGGHDDIWAPPESMKHWEKITTVTPIVELFDGDHMFIRGESKSNVVGSVKELILEQ